MTGMPSIDGTQLRALPSVDLPQIPSHWIELHILYKGGPVLTLVLLEGGLLFFFFFFPRHTQVNVPFCHTMPSNLQTEQLAFSANYLLTVVSSRKACSQAPPCSLLSFFFFFLTQWQTQLLLWRRLHARWHLSNSPGMSLSLTARKTHRNTHTDTLRVHGAEGTPWTTQEKYHLFVLRYVFN